MRRLVVAAAGAVTLAAAGGGWLYAAAADGYQPAAIVRPAADAGEAGRLAAAERALSRARPRTRLVVVDTAGNRLAVVEPDGTLDHLAPASTGSGTVLRDPVTGRIWVFETPLGALTVLRKTKNPVWVKPDWAFIEEGERPPPAGSPERYDDVSLGDYALYMRDGYIIHGTLFQTLLGRGVTHGCIRLGDEDLEHVYRRVPVGAPVLIF